MGSVGTRAWIVLMLGRDESDPLFLQLKEAQASVLEPFLGKSAFANHGQRVVEGQRLTQAASDIMLGWIAVTACDGVSRDFYVRQLWDGKGSALVELMDPRGDDDVRGALRPGAREGARPLRRRDRDRELPRRAATASTARWRRSRRPTPTRTSATTAPCRRPSRPAGSRPRPASSRGRTRFRAPRISSSIGDARSRGELVRSTQFDHELKESRMESIDRTVLPMPDPEFKGKIDSYPEGLEGRLGHAGAGASAPGGARTSCSC